MVKCVRCKKKAEFYVADNTKKKFCEDHAIKYLTTSEEDFLPRL